MGPLDKGTQYKLNFQPVIPLALNKDWNLIICTIVPYVSQEDVFKAPLPKSPVCRTMCFINFPVRCPMRTSARRRRLSTRRSGNAFQTMRIRMD